MKTIRYAHYSDSGTRPVNEDSLGVFERTPYCLAVLCDGLGGHGMGDAASRLVVGSFEKHMNAGDGTIKKDFLQVCFLKAQEDLLAEQKRLKEERRMKTTAVALLTDGKKAMIAHVGDSRCYVFSKGKVWKRTLDHSVPQMLVLAGAIAEKDIRSHEQRSSLLRVLGVEWESNQTEEMKPIPLRKCDAFLLCSDGFWELITEEEMEDHLSRAASVRDWLDAMQETVKQRGTGQEMDNHSAIALWCR